MKKYLNILVAICMAVTCLGAVPVWADENSSNNFKSLSVYVTDGYNPIEGASISISNQTATSGADGTAVFDAVPTSTDVYHMTVTHEDYGVRENDILILPNGEQAQETLVSFWSPAREAQIPQLASATETASYANSWEYVDTSRSNSIKLIEYGGLIYVCCNNNVYAFNPTTETCAEVGALSSKFVFRYGDALYSYSVTSGHDNEEREYYTGRFNKLDISDDNSGNMIELKVLGTSGRDYNSATMRQENMYLIGGDYYTLGSNLSNKYISSFDVVESQFEYEFININSDEGTPVLCSGEHEGKIYVFHKNGTVIIHPNGLTTTLSSIRRYYAGQSATYANGKIYLIGGTRVENKLFIYDLATGTLQSGADCPRERVNHAAVLLDNKIYVLGGDKSGKIVDVYDISSDSWSMCAAADISIGKDNAVAYGGKIYAIDSDGKMGIYTPPTGGSFTTNAPVAVDYSGDITQVDASRAQTLAIDSDNNVIAWGEGYYADGSISMKAYSEPQTISGITNPVKVSRGKNHNLVLDSAGDVWGWGSNSNNPMGSGASKFTAAKKISGISGVTDIDAGAEFSVFLKSDGSVWGVGKNDKGQMATALTTEYISDPVQLSGVSGVTQISAGDDYVVALASDGIYTWGGNGYGQLGDGSKTDNYVPTKLNITLPDGESFTDICAGGRFAMALTNLGNVYVWGDNGNGEYGLGNNDTDYYTPKLCTNLSNITALAAGVNNALAVKSDGTVYGWGFSRSGNIGISAGGSVVTPTAISGLSGKNIVSVTCGYDFSVALSSDGTAYAFGNNALGSLGVDSLN